MRNSSHDSLHVGWVENVPELGGSLWSNHNGIRGSFRNCRRKSSFESLLIFLIFQKKIWWHRQPSKNTILDTGAVHFQKKFIHLWFDMFLLLGAVAVHIREYSDHLKNQVWSSRQIKLAFFHVSDFLNNLYLKICY